MSKGLIIFIKNPVPGKVKTRVAEDLGNEKALEIYRELCLITRKVAQKFEGKLYVFYSDEILRNDEWQDSIYQKYEQVGQDLGERMADAFSKLLPLHDILILIGSDCPYLSSEDLGKASMQLQHMDCVLGPAEDGGYYLIGLRKMIPELFVNKSWSSRKLYSETIQTLKEVGASVFSLHTLSDIDYATDWEAYKKMQNLS